MVYKLSATLTNHSSDVRAVAAPTPDLVLSASRDATALAWTRAPELDNELTPTRMFRAGQRYINSLTYIPPSADAPAGYVVTGGQDAVVNVFSLDRRAKFRPLHSLSGHAGNVCALHARPDGTIISGSWDQTARVWVGFQPALVLVGHEQAVWAVLAIEDDQYVTGSADMTIKIWKQGKVLRTLTGHSDVVRGLAQIPDVGFASCSNDCDIIIWSLRGEPVRKLTGHTAYVYSLAALPSGNLVSSGEDRSARVWKGGELAQTIPHPAVSVWSVAAMPNGDIVTGSSDNVVRVFSEVPERWAEKSELKWYDEELARQVLPAELFGDFKKDELPELDALEQRGDEDGELLMVRNGKKIEVHQWCMPTASWLKIGEVAEPPPPTRIPKRKQSFEGNKYDYVFSVDVEDGAPPLKLPYNTEDDPQTAAKQFVEKNKLPQSYLNDIVRFIETNTGGVTRDGDTANSPAA
ncbi:WD-40 repeat-containing protein [Auriculariales sp. MPI-PUGE-AT-0066]|nr:WD-40 repeat-containing protein [Auriculariales sp. MPI-PUGE-AT-0066]